MTWLTLPTEWAEPALERARAECGGVAAWLSAAACMAVCAQQQNRRQGRVSLNMLLSRGDLSSVGGFGFAAGSLLIPVKLRVHCELTTVARDIFARQSGMLAENWDEQLRRFIGTSPRRQRSFAAAFARGWSDSTINVSWKGVYPELGGTDGLRDIACFAASRAVHISAHSDRNGLSISVTSCQSPSDREELLGCLVGVIGGAPGRSLRTLQGVSTCGVPEPPARQRSLADAGFAIGDMAGR